MKDIIVIWRQRSDAVRCWGSLWALFSTPRTHDWKRSSIAEAEHAVAPGVCEHWFCVTNGISFSETFVCAVLVVQEPIPFLGQPKVANVLTHKTSDGDVTGNDKQASRRLVTTTAIDRWPQWWAAMTVGRNHGWTLFIWLIKHQPTLLFCQNKPTTNNQLTILLSQNKPADFKYDEEACCEI